MCSVCCMVSLCLIQRFSLDLKPGKMTALVGISGGGKSTCVSLLQKFYQPQDGQILLDGQPLQNYQHKYLHRKVMADIYNNMQTIPSYFCVNMFLVDRFIHNSNI